jgi:bla regulator protein BlaR1
MSDAIVDHLWQSSLVAAAAWALTLVLRGHSARVRHAIWFAASLKFLVPFSLFYGIGAAIAGSLELPVPSTIARFSTHELGVAIWTPASQATALDSVDVAWLRIAGLVWMAGVIVMVARWLVRWREIAALVKAARPADIVAPVRVLLSPTSREPGVVGVFRPVMLIPDGLDARLSPEQLRAIVAHELCHVRRHDNLKSSIHMLVESLFWFLPIVWWIGARLIDERERACDETVVGSGHDARVYGEAIIEICKHFRASNLPCVAGVSGADLKQRLEGIMKTDGIRRLDRGHRLLLATIAAAALVAPIGAGLAASTPAAQAVTVELLPGKRVKLDYRDVDVRSLLAAMAKTANVNMLVSDRVTGTVTVKLAETPWDKALGIILHSQGLVKREQDGITFVEPSPTK